jgi:hypothetical protein
MTSPDAHGLGIIVVNGAKHAEKSLGFDLGVDIANAGGLADCLLTILFGHDRKVVL